MVSGVSRTGVARFRDARATGRFFLRDDRRGLHCRAGAAPRRGNEKETFETGVMNITIEPLSIELYDRVLSLWQQSQGVGLSHADSREGIESYLNRNPGMSFVALAGRVVAGAVLAGHDGRRGYIHHLSVHPEFRGQGLARGLVDRCLQVLKQAGIEKSHILIFKANEKGMTFWKNAGWTFRSDLRVMSKNI